MTLETALTSPNLTTIRTVSHQGRYCLSYARHITVATAQINQVSFSVPLGQVTVDNTSADWLTEVREGLTAWIGTTAGARDIGVYLVRKVPTSTILYLMEIPTGDPGLLALRQPKALINDAYITIKKAPNIWSVFPRINFLGGTEAEFFKKFDLAYVDQNETGGAVPGIVNIGEHVSIYVGDGNTYTDTRSTSITLFDGTVSARLWTYDSAGSVVSGSTSSSSIGIEYPPGNYVISCKVTTSGGAIIEVDRYIWVYDDSTNPVTEVQVLNQTITEEGCSFSAEFIEALPDDILAGAMVVLWEQTNSTAIASATTHAVGFIDRIDGDVREGVGVATLNVISPLNLMEKVRGFSLRLEAVGLSPTYWGEVSASLSTLDFFIFHVLYWHTTLLRLFDFSTSGRNRTKFIWKANQGTWLQAVNTAAELDDCKLTQDSHGNLYIRRDPQMMTVSEKNAVVVRMTITEDDIVQDSLRIERVLRPSTGKVMGYGLSTHTTYDTVIGCASIATGGTGGQGTGEVRIDRLASSAELLVLSGNMLAKSNNPFPTIAWDMMTNYLVIEPALRYFLLMDVTSPLMLPTQEALDFNVIPLEVNIRYQSDPETGTYRSSVSVTATADTNGNSAPGIDDPITARDGLDVYIPDLGLNGLPIFDYDLFIPPIVWGLPDVFDVVPETSTEVLGTPGSGRGERHEIIAWYNTDASNGDFSRIYRCADYTVGSPTWTQISGSGNFGLRVVQALAKKNSREIFTLHEAGYLWYIANPGVSTPVELADWSGSGIYSWLMRITKTNKVVIFGSNSTHQTVHVWDGSTLSSAVNIGPKTSEEYHGDVDDFDLGLVVAAANRGIYFSTTYGGSFTATTGLPSVLNDGGSDLTNSISMIRVPYLKVSGALNNNLSDMEFIYSVYGTDVRRARYNFSSNSYISSESIRPTTFPGGGTYTVFAMPASFSGFLAGGHALEVYGGDANIIVGSFYGGGSYTALGLTIDGGATWTKIDTYGVDHMYTYYHFVEPLRGGDGNKIWTPPDYAAKTNDQMSSIALTMPAMPSAVEVGVWRGIIQL